MQNSFEINLDKCTGCDACRIACAIENNLDPGASWRSVNRFNAGNYPGLPVFHLSLSCNHCLEPVCLKYCPALAYEKDQENGAVTINADKCIGCKYCSWVCPFDAPKFNEREKVMEKCTFCIDRLKRGAEPACVMLCPTGALTAGKYENGSLGRDIPGFTDTTLRPAINVKPVRNNFKPPEQSNTSELPADNKINGNRLKKSKIRLKSEWPLALFTITAAILTGVFSGSLFSTLRVNPFVYFAAGFLTMLLSAAHLGRKERIFRAILNIRNSWLSREVLFYSLFLGFSTLFFLLNSHHSYTAWIITFTGFAALFSIDKIYQVMPQTGIPNLHSSQIFLSGLFWCGIFSGNAFMYSWFGIMKFVLYIFRKTNFRKKKQRTYPIISLARLTIGFVIPLVMLNLYRFEYSIEAIYIIIFVFSGELIDRFEFYNELEIITPEKQIEIDMAKMLRQRKEEIEFENLRSRSSLGKGS